MPAMVIPTTEPTVVTAGDAIAWKKALADYPASAGWVLKYRLINAAGSIDITATASGSDHAVSASAATSAIWRAGAYTWHAYVENAAERYTVGTGKIVVKPNLAAMAAGFDARGTWAKAAEDLRAALATWLSTSGHVQEYEIAGRRMKFAAAADIQARLAIADRQAAREAIASGASADLGKPIYVRFKHG